MDIRELTYTYYLRNRTTKRIPSNWESYEVVELGAGSSNYSHLFGEENYTAVDLDPIIGKYVKKFVQADIADLPFKENSFDVFIAISLLEHMNDPLSVLKRLIRICPEGGYATIPVLDEFPFLYDPINWIRLRLGKTVMSFGIAGFGHVSILYKKDWVKMFNEAGYSVT